MGLGQLPLMAALTEKMRWHQARQSVLAENIANAETPGYRARDLESFQFGDALDAIAMTPVGGGRADPGHLVLSAGGADGFAAERAGAFEVRPRGTAVSLEDEMMKITANQMDYQAVTTLYTRSVRLIRTALGRQA